MASCSFKVVVTDNEIPELVACPTNITKSCDVGECSAIVSWTEPSVNDNCTSSENISWVKSHTPGTVFSLGTTTVTYKGIDEAGNESLICSFTVTVEDTEKPVISNCPINITQNSDSNDCGAVVSWIEPSASDNCTSSGDLTWAKSHNIGDRFDVGTTTVTYTAIDAGENISNACSFDIIISASSVNGEPDGQVKTGGVKS